MKIYKLIPLFLLFIIACDPQENLNADLNSEDHSIYITGINKALSYEFANKNGRVEQSIPSDINMLHLAVLDGEGEVVYDEYYYNHNSQYEYYYDSADTDPEYFENTLPDTLFIPQLPDGEYSIIAATTYINNYYAYYNESGYHEEDSVDYPTGPSIDSYNVSGGPIFIGKEMVTISNSETIAVEMGMRNISSRVDLNVINASSDSWYFEVQIQSSNSKYYSFNTDILESYNHDYYGNVHMYLDPWYSPNEFYFLPRTAESITFYFYDYITNIQLSQTLDIDPDIEMTIGDVLTLNVDMQEILSGSGNASFDWEDVNWNDVGEITIP